LERNGKQLKMSLRFERKGSLRIPSSLKWKKVKEEASAEEDYVRSWSYRQCQFACDYLNLMDTPPVVQAQKNPEPGPTKETGRSQAQQRPKLLNPLKDSRVLGETAMTEATHERSPTSTISWSSRGSTTSTTGTGGTESSRSSICTYYGGLWDLGLELELDGDETVSFNWLIEKSISFIWFSLNEILTEGEGGLATW